MYVYKDGNYMNILGIEIYSNKRSITLTRKKKLKYEPCSTILANLKITTNLACAIKDQF
jgi:hypothetical protein